MTNVASDTPEVNDTSFAEKYAHLDKRHPAKRFKVTAAVKWIDKGGILTRDSANSTVSTTTALLNSLREDEEHLADDIRLFHDSLPTIHNRFVIDKDIPLRQPRTYYTRAKRLAAEYLRFLDQEGSYSPPPRRMIKRKAKVAVAPAAPVQQEEDETPSTEEIGARLGVEIVTLPSGTKAHWHFEGEYTIEDTKRIQAIMAMKAADFDYTKLVYQG